MQTNLLTASTTLFLDMDNVQLRSYSGDYIGVTCGDDYSRGYAVKRSDVARMIFGDGSTPWLLFRCNLCAWWAAALTRRIEEARYQDSRGNYANALEFTHSYIRQMERYKQHRARHCQSI